MFASVCYALDIRRQYVVPLTKVSGEASRFAKESARGEPFGRTGRIKEISEPAGSIEKVKADMIASNQDLTMLCMKYKKENESC